jgi:hypothetical protein
MVDVWAVLLIFAAGVAIGRWDDRRERRNRADMPISRETAAVIRRAMDRARHQETKGGNDGPVRTAP